MFVYLKQYILYPWNIYVLKHIFLLPILSPLPPYGYDNVFVYLNSFLHVDSFFALSACMCEDIRSPGIGVRVVS